VNAWTLSPWALMMALLSTLAVRRLILQALAAFEDWRRRRAAKKAWKR
jgi:hypothetical protein